MKLHKILVNASSELKPVSNPNEIDQSLELFKKRFMEVVDLKIEAPTRSGKLPLLWSSKLKIWGYFGFEDNGYYNPFGIGKPDTSSNNQSICEINPPYQNIKKTSGLFAKNSSGKIFLLHRGVFSRNRFQKDDKNVKWVEITDGE